MRDYNPYDWYWLADDGRLFSSKRSAVLAASDDEDFSAWSKEGGLPTRWPADDAGKQTIAVLQAVIAPYGLHADLATYAAAKQQTILDAGLVVDVGTKDAPALIFASMDGQSIGFLNAAADDAGKDSNYSVTWVSRLGVIVLDAAQILAIKAAVTTFVQSGMKVLGQVMTDIAAGKTTTTAQIDAYAWPASASA